MFRTDVRKTWFHRAAGESGYSRQYSMSNFLDVFYCGQVWASLGNAGHLPSKGLFMNRHQPPLPKPYQRYPYPFSYPFTIRGLVLISWD